MSVSEYINLARAESPFPGINPTCPTREKCKDVAKKSFDVLSFISGLCFVGLGAVFVIGERAGVAPNRGAGLGAVTLGLVIVRGNYKEIRNWNVAF